MNNDKYLINCPVCGGDGKDAEGNYAECVACEGTGLIWATLPDLPRKEAANANDPE